MTDAERKRIKEEEAYRRQVQKDLEKEEKRKRANRSRNGCMTAVAVIVGIILLLNTLDSPSGSATSSVAANNPQNSYDGPTFDVTFTSDPSGARLYVDGEDEGITPETVAVPANRNLNYRLVADEPYKDYNLYEPYNGTINVSKDQNISVWIPRTTAEEQVAARQAAEKERREAAHAACLRRLDNAELVIENWRWYAQYGYAIAEGKVTNRSGETLRNIEAVIEIQTSSGQFITSSSSLLDYTDLLPGQSSPFKIYASYNPAMARASLSFRELLGGRVGAIKRTELNCNEP